ncbi:hypothetical protein FQN53_002433 [Emmonsiellopsis sp. PD_33]|nr:hypothetical protein FQN53_002433 [Emmonsiellopsis sp. PD_33]KAK2799143.1 hypothetical protein FQN51_007111 [Onygenales sp. PD_10]
MHGNNPHSPIEFLLKQTNAPLIDYIKSLSFGSTPLVTGLLPLDESDLQRLWQDGTETCTSFAIFVSHRLEETFKYKFTLYDNGFHRAALSLTEEPSVIVDSSAHCLLTTNREEPVNGYDGIWRVRDRQILDSKKSPSASYTPFTRLPSFETGMKNCLMQLSASTSDVYDHCLVFNGWILIDFELKFIEFSYPGGTRYEFCQASYTTEGRFEAEAEFVVNLRVFGNGSVRHSSFMKLFPFLLDIIKALREVYGYPPQVEFYEK